MKKGDIVLLKSGSPLMTIKSVNGHGFFSCTYWNSKNHSFSDLDDVHQDLLVEANSYLTPVYYGEEIKVNDRFFNREKV